MAIDSLPDVALLDIFEFYMDEALDEDQNEAWHTLVHVCRNWRIVVFGSPRRLALRIYCDYTTPVREKLHIWPLLPIVVRLSNWDMLCAQMNNIVGALEHNDRICECKLRLFDSPISKFQKIVAAIQQPLSGIDMYASCV